MEDRVVVCIRHCCTWSDSHCLIDLKFSRFLQFPSLHLELSLSSFDLGAQFGQKVRFIERLSRFTAPLSPLPCWRRIHDFIRSLLLATSSFKHSRLQFIMMLSQLLFIHHLIIIFRIIQYLIPFFFQCSQEDDRQPCFMLAIFLLIRLQMTCR